MDFSFVTNYYPYYVSGTIVTLIISLLAILIGVVIGTFICLMKISKVRTLRTFGTLYVELFRGVPLLVQVLIWAVVLSPRNIQLPQVTFFGAITLARTFPALIALSINSSAYIAEIFRSGINAVDSGQEEAASSLGLRPKYTMIDVILPQAVRNILPALGNEFVTVVKESSILSILGTAELMRQTQNIISITYMDLEPYLICALIYLVLTYTLSRLVSLLEKRMNKGYS